MLSALASPAMSAAPKLSVMQGAASLAASSAAVRILARSALVERNSFLTTAPNALVEPIDPRPCRRSFGGRGLRHQRWGHGEATARALPHAVKVADRWHLMENASRPFLDAARKSMRQIRTVIGATTIPKLLTAAERFHYEGYLRREETNAAAWLCRKTACPSSRSCVRLAIAGSRYGRQSAANGTCLPDPGEVRWTCTCRGSTISGRPAVETGLNFGVA